MIVLVGGKGLWVKVTICEERFDFKDHLVGGDFCLLGIEYRAGKYKCEKFIRVKKNGNKNTLFISTGGVY